jgi:hypothetical protein
VKHWNFNIVSFSLLSGRKIQSHDVNVSLCLTNKALCHEDVCGSGGITPQFVTSALDGGE